MAIRKIKPIKYDYSYNVSREVDVVVKGFQSIQESFNKLPQRLKDTESKTLLTEIKSQAGVDNFNDKFISISNGENKIILFSEKPNSVRISEEDLKTQKTKRNVLLSFNRLEEARGFSSEKNAVETFLQNVVSMFDFPILKLRRFFLTNDISELLKKYIPTQPTQTKSINLPNTSTVKTNTDFKTNFSNYPVISEISAQLQETKDLFSTVKGPSNKGRIKRAYPNYKSDTEAPAAYQFKRIGLNGEDISVRKVKDKLGLENLIIKLTSPKNEAKHIIICENGKIYKEKFINGHCIIGTTNERYSSQEIQDLDLENILTPLKEEFPKFRQFLKPRIENLNKFIDNNTTYSVGIIPPENQTQVSQLTEKLITFKKQMKRVPRSQKEVLKQNFNFETRESSSMVTFKNVGKENYNLQFGVVKFLGKYCPKLNILNEQGIATKCYIIDDNKIVKMRENTTIQRKTGREYTEVHYYSQEEIEKLGLNKYFEYLNNRLNNILDRKKIYS